MLKTTKKYILIFQDLESGKTKELTVAAKTLIVALQEAFQKDETLQNYKLIDYTVSDELENL